MNDESPRRRSIASLKKEAKRWLAALQDGTAEARERFIAALGTPPQSFTLREVQHALARELGFPGWTALRDASDNEATPELAEYEEKARALLDAYNLGTPEAMERHYRLTWHRRAWSGMRRYVQLDLGKRPSTPDADDVEITIDDARYLIAVEHDFRSWGELVASVRARPVGVALTSAPVGLRAGMDDDAAVLFTTRDWTALLSELEEQPDAVLDARGQMTDDVLSRVADFSHITSLRLANSQALTDEGIRHLARLPQLRHLQLGSTGITDRGLEVLAALPKLESLDLVMTAVTDAGVHHLRNCQSLRRLNLMWTRTGDGAIRALAGMEQLTHFWSGNLVTNAGLAALHDIPAFARWRGGNPDIELLSAETMLNQLSLRGPFTDEGIAHMRGLDGLFALNLDDAALALTAQAMKPLATLPNLGWLSVDAKDDWMAHIAAMPALRHLSAQDTTAGDDGFVALSASHTIESIWGRRCHNLRTRGFKALSHMPALAKLSVSCLNVTDDGIATLPGFPSLRELMPMDIPDAGYRHIGRCGELEALTLMYCRNTTDAATEHITGLTKLKRYFNSYTLVTDRTPRLLSTMDSLERITFDTCHGLTDDGIASLARLPRLTELRVSGRGITPGVGSPFRPGVSVRYGG